MNAHPRSVLGTFLIVVGSLVTLFGVAAIVQPVLEGSNRNGILVGVAGSVFYFLLGGGLATMGVGLNRRARSRVEAAFTDDGSSLTRIGIAMAVTAVVGVLLIAGLLILFVDGIRDST